MRSLRLFLLVLGSHSVALELQGCVTREEAVGVEFADVSKLCKFGADPAILEYKIWTIPSENGHALADAKLDKDVKAEYPDATEYTSLHCERVGSNFESRSCTSDLKSE